MTCHRVHLAVLLGVLLIGCGVEARKAPTGAPVASTIRELDPPAGTGAFAPRLVASDGELLLTWWQPVAPAPAATGAEEGIDHRLMFSRFVDGWSSPAVVVEGDDFFANWADFPTVIREPSGSLLAHWLVKTAEATYAYSIELARSADDGASWRPLGRLNDDATDTEHGFVSLVPEGDAVRAYWLDGRATVDGGAMGLRTARIGDSVGTSELLDERVCDCCPTDAVATAEGSLIIYRDRSEDETRDIYAVRRADGDWESPAPVGGGGWRIPGCPVQGPAVAWRDGRMAAAWFTGAGSEPRVAMRFGLEADAAPVVIDAERPLGRVGVALDRDGSAVVSWLALVEDEAELRLRRATPTGTLGEPLALGRTSGSRASGMPQLVRLDEKLYAAWVEVFEGSDSRLRVREIPVVLVPEA